jgi:hypothetical protein
MNNGRTAFFCEDGDNLDAHTYPDRWRIADTVSTFLCGTRAK